MDKVPKLEKNISWPLALSLDVALYSQRECSVALCGYSAI